MEEIRKRTKVLEYSLKLESFVSYELANLLDISDYKSSKSLGNGSSALSINQKLNLLLDVENIDKKEKSTIEYFMSIRNQFMHNIDAVSFSYVIRKLDGLENKLKKEYPHNFKQKNDEKGFELCIESLFHDSIKILLDQKGNKLRKIMLLAAAESHEILKDKLRESLDKQIQLLEDFFKNYPEDKIDKYLVLTKIVLMDIEIEKETIDNTLIEIEKIKNPQKNTKNGI
ncbi:hypothetical protein HYN48_13435 [Flavobacterium magnum]|uniref:Uncharacterized protein n=1 Tax=Flavobacterium magnum TaxID=2162713 RepID=A0A2S0RJV6_9FLAO|nr:hypothetical protein [Flavobacterium magnum]AWA31002.1 hypothetical protein HYN48_13435 [Flavobacterium magnum]